MIPEREARLHDAFNPLIPRVKRRLRKQRMQICRECDKLNGLEQCAVCNCYMPIKTMLPHASCPEGKWDAEPDV
ncbi:MAG: DUF6171 family protein [Ilumatobacteraceae bacterium]